MRIRKRISRCVKRWIQKHIGWDDPEYDSTDWAHPAWWRGDLHGLQGATRLIENIISGKEAGVGAMQEDADKLRQMVLGLKRKADSLVDEYNSLKRERDDTVQDRDSLAQDRAELEWKYDAMCKARVAWVKRSSGLQSERDSLKRERDSLRCDVERLEQDLNKHRRDWNERHNYT